MRLPLWCRDDGRLCCRCRHDRWLAVTVAVFFSHDGLRYGRRRHCRRYGNRLLAAVTASVSMFRRRRSHGGRGDKRRSRGVTASMFLANRLGGRDKRRRGSGGVASSVFMSLIQGGGCRRDHRRQDGRGLPSVSPAVAAVCTFDYWSGDNRLLASHPSVAVILDSSGRRE